MSEKLLIFAPIYRVIIMKPFFSFFSSLCLFTLCAMNAQAQQTIIPDGVYYISCISTEGYVGLGAYHNDFAQIFYVTDGQPKTVDAYWEVRNTPEGATFRNEATGQYLVFTYDRDDLFYKYLTLASEVPTDNKHFWSIEPYDGDVVCVRSIADPSYFWNLRNSSRLLGAYAGSSRATNEMFVFHKKGDDGSDPVDPVEPVKPETLKAFPEALHVFMKDGRVEAYPLEYVVSHSQDERQVIIETTFGETLFYPLAQVDSISTCKPEYPTFTSFKFNNKFNDQLFTDCVGEIQGDTVWANVGAIGKRLTPSFKVSDTRTEVYQEGLAQDSKVSRLRFDKDIYYVLSLPGHQILLPTVDEKDTVYTMQPYGRMVRVHVDWLTDHSENVPRIDINTENEEWITSKEYYLNAEITIDGAGVFPSMPTTPVQIKGRGNSSWGGSSRWTKNPYRLKFPEKVKPFGMPKGRSWVLLANKIGGSILSNAVGMKIATMVETSAANHIIPVELYINGDYRGNYNFTEKTGFSNNSVDIEDETAAAFLELDSYYDEPAGQKFRTNAYNLPINVKQPDFSEDSTLLTLKIVRDEFNEFTDALQDLGDISSYVDIESLARFLMVNDLICNYELYHPKSTFCYREDFLNDSSKFVFGPVWDLDWAFGYERNHNYFEAGATDNYFKYNGMEVPKFIHDLRGRDQQVDRAYYFIWKDFMENHLEELLEYCQDYYDYARPSLENNRDLWGDWTDYEKQVGKAQDWLATRANHIFNQLTVYDVHAGKRGDVNGDEQVDMADIMAIIDIISEQTAGSIAADVNGDREVNVADIMAVIEIIGDLDSSKVQEILDLVDAIRPLRATEMAKPHIYRLDGTRVNGDASSLQKGIYIINGRKVLVK